MKKILHTTEVSPRQLVSYLEYTRVHNWIRSKHKSAFKCVNKKCPKTSNIFDWALKHGKMYDSNIKNFKQLCRKCHQQYDRHRHYFAVVQFSLKGKKLKTFPSLGHAAKALKRRSAGRICSHIVGKGGHSAYGYIWQYADDIDMDCVKKCAEYTKNKYPPHKGKICEISWCKREKSPAYSVCKTKPRWCRFHMVGKGKLTRQKFVVTKKYNQ